MFKVKTKYKMISFWCFYCWFWPESVYQYSVSTFNFEQAFVSRVWKTINKERVNVHFCQFSQKETFFYTLKQQKIFLISLCGFEGVQHFWLDLCIFFSKLLSATNQQLFCVTESDIGQGPSNHTPPLYKLLVSVVWLTLSFGEVSKTCRRMH